MISIRLAEPFEVIHSHPGHQIHLDVASHFDSSLPLHFKLLDSPAWLILSEQGLLTGVAPAVKYDSQFIVMVAAWNSHDLLTQKFFINVIPETMLDSLKEPMLVLSMVNKPQFPHEKPLLTREILTYIFGYYHQAPHGEQFFTKLREKANALYHPLPALLSTASLVAFFESLRPTEQYALLEPTVEPQVFEEARRAEIQPEHEKIQETESLSFSGHNLRPHEHTLLEYVFAHLVVHHAEKLEEMLHEMEQKKVRYSIGEAEKAMPHYMFHGELFERFKTVVREKQPELEKKLESLAPKYPLLKKAKLTDEELKECCLAGRLKKSEEPEKLEGLRLLVNYHGRQLPDEILDMELLEEFFPLLELAVEKHRHEHTLDSTEGSYKHFFPHPTPSREKL